MTISDRYSAVDETNLQQAAAWDGEEGDEWTVHADRYDAACRRYDPHLINGAQLAAADRVLDVGCGTGLSSRDAAQVVVDGSVTGIDLSARMIAEARRRSTTMGLTNTRFIVGDAQTYPFRSAAFDAIISRFGAMFFGDPVAAFINLGHSLSHGGRLALLSWQALANNEWVLALRDTLAAGRALPEPPAGAPGPFGLAEPTDIHRILTTAGFDDIRLTEVREPMYLGADSDDAFSFVSGLGLTRGLLAGLDDHTRHAALEALRNRLDAHTTSDGVLLGATAWLLTARRTRSNRGN
jgi:SAM-dependent methyltransferase